MNKNISVWRGILSPPTQNHIWIKDENSLLKFDKEQNKWINLLNVVTYDSDGLMSKEDKYILDVLNENSKWN